MTDAQKIDLIEQILLELTPDDRDEMHDHVKRGDETFYEWIIYSIINVIDEGD